MRSIPALLLTRSPRVGVEERCRNELDEALLLEQAGIGSWRVCDGRIATGSGRLLGFIDKRAGCFEVMQIADDFIWSTFPSMRAALTHIVATTPAVVLARSDGDLAWLQ